MGARSQAEPFRSPGLLTVPEAARYANVTERMIRRLISDRRLPFHRLGRHIRIKVSDLDRWIESGRVAASHPDARPAFERARE